ncbi:PREDICTED: myosin-binding protein 7-like [Camelina sativa]|uniref:Myosin-binding protein 7-like n=1 Tax=Camelina sativa TaxID=90675 RepID=A0ABM0TJ69_CAMSA|nr:PREDICTED: myosin-binding protein 7-like [Camelina sativa]XP_010427184.1 PREDICTED: myosin-binding protein 7-like [Camelina sativa]XP_010427186.1 PREDICTED: myosin-binding protein 7-like [Camelina sativa]
MDSELRFASKDVVKCCDVGCDYSLGASSSSSDPWTRTVKRKFNEFKEGNMLLLRGSSDSSSNAKVLVENECAALLEVLSSQRKTVKDLHLELEEERNAAASAANETMSMILRLQREKAEIQMEARQFKMFAEEKMTHDREKLTVLENLLYEKEQAIEALTYEVEAYKHKLLSYGVSEAEMHEQILGFGRDSSTVGFDVYPCEYTSLKCTVDENPSGPDGNVEVEEKVIVGQSPRWPYYDPNSPLGTAKDIKGTCFADSPMSSSSDRVYTIDSIHVGVSEVKIDDEPNKMSKGKLNGDHWNSPRYQEPFTAQQGVNEPDIEKLYTRLQALEADRESLRQIIVSMRTDKAQLVLLKEIAQQLTKEAGTTNRRNPVCKMPSFKGFTVVTVFKWIVSFVSWKRKARRNKYVYELSANNKGMLMMLGEGSGTRRWRCLTSSHV